MEVTMKLKFTAIFFWSILVCILGTYSLSPAADSGSSQSAVISGLKPELTLAQGSSLSPGLLPIYIDKFVRHIVELPLLDPKTTQAKRGKPILILNKTFGIGEKIFDSGRSRGLGIQMYGFIKFAQVGQYELMAKSNDGIRVTICGKITVDDPKVHGDQFSNVSALNITSPGWYPVMIQYFQRKGTACIEMHWKEPGSSQFTIIPADAYAHRADAKTAP
jgi:hypothetical protein